MDKFPEYHESGADALDTVLDWVRWGATCFTQAGLHFGHGTENAWDEALFLLSAAIHQSWEMFDQIQFAKLTQSEKLSLYHLYKRRVEERVPAPYLTGVAWFAGYPYKVTRDVLVPRSPIAELILKDFQPWLSKPPSKILDLCTGSGCIGIACAHQFGDASVDLCDISAAAVDVAQANIHFHQVEDRVQALQSDLFEALSGCRYDLIVTNPPYVDEQDFISMPEEYRAEPKLGLSAGADGLDIIRRILRQASQYLADDGIIVAEVGNSWQALEEIFPHMAFTWPDLENGGHGVFVLSKSQLVNM